MHKCIGGGLLSFVVTSLELVSCKAFIYNPTLHAYMINGDGILNGNEFDIHLAKAIVIVFISCSVNRHKK